MTMPPYGPPPQGRPWLPPPRPRRWTWHGGLLGTIGMTVVLLSIVAVLLYGRHVDQQERQHRTPGVTTTTR